MELTDGDGDDDDATGVYITGVNAWNSLIVMVMRMRM